MKKILIIKSVKGSDRDENNHPMPVKLYEKDKSYMVGDELASALIPSFAQDFEGEILLEEPKTAKIIEGVSVEDGQSASLDIPWKKKRLKR